MQPGEALTMMTLFLACAATIFGYVYLRSRENMALIERGINPRRAANAPQYAHASLKYGLLLVGAGLGLLIAFWLDTMITQSNLGSHTEAGEVYRLNTEPLYFALLAIGGGTGLWLSYKVRAKQVQALPPQQQD